MASQVLDRSGAVTLETAPLQEKTALSDTLRRLGTASGRPLRALLGDFLKASIGPGRLNFDEFVALGLYDPSRYGGTDIRGFAGLGAMQRIWQRANFRDEFDGLVANKIAMNALLDAYAFPVIPILALFSTAARHSSEHALCTTGAMRDFLRNPTHYPLFGKPVTGTQSLGTAGFTGFDAAGDALIGFDGTSTALDDFVGDVAAHYSDGYIFQRHVSPHPEIRAICGNRLATVRIVTIVGSSGPKILSACEKIPAGGNAADNYWRPGNLLVQLERQRGLRGRVTSGKGLELKQHTRHPDTGAPITATAVPNWAHACDLALRGARLMAGVGLMGWDIAPVDEGAVIVEANATPDLMLPQLASRRGMLDSELREFLAERGRAQKAWKRGLRARSLAQHRVSFMT